jgi:hypothetical protein
MAFPFPATSSRTFTPTELQSLRQSLIDNAIIQPRGPQGDLVAEQLAQITQVLSRTATNETTTYENGVVSTSATGTSNLLTRQVDRAITQVLGRSPGQGSAGFMKALYGAFPTAANGQVMLTPARSMVSLYSPYGTEKQIYSDGGGFGGYAGSNSNGLGGQLSVEQANLYRQASVIATDALRVLAGIEPFDPTADVDAVEALRTLVQSQINTLVEEFGRIDEPRPDRVNVYFNTLLINVNQMGDRARLSSSRTGFSGSSGLIVFPVTAEDEAQIAALDLLKNYINTLKNIWIDFLGTSPSEALSNNYSERLTRVNILLPVIASSNTSFMAAMDSVGLTESERRSDAALFTSINSDSFPLSIDGSSVPGGEIGSVSLSNITVNDFNEWVDRFTTIEAPSILATSGRFGLDFVTDQADTLFWVIGFVLDAINIRSGPNGTTSETFLETFLKFERVKQTLNELVFQLDTLADFAVQPPSNNGSRR